MIDLFMDRPLAETVALPDGELILADALRAGAPVVAFLGQSAGWSGGRNDPVLLLALKKASKTGGDWKALLSRETLPQSFFEWLGERFINRAPSQELLTIADTAFSAIYTSSIDPGLVNLFATEGRQPEPILIGDPPPPVLRSRRRMPVYYLFGRAGAGTGDFIPPSTFSASQSQVPPSRHRQAMAAAILPGDCPRRRATRGQP